MTLPVLGRPCFICNSEEWCRHREPEVEAAVLERYLLRAHEIESLQPRIEVARTAPVIQSTPEITTPTPKPKWSMTGEEKLAVPMPWPANRVSSSDAFRRRA